MTNAHEHGRLFGTDGIRGPFGTFPLDRETVIRLAYELASMLRNSGATAPEVLLGGDTRASTPQICQWLSLGLKQGGATPRFGGVLPTPAIASLTRDSGAVAGIAVSASHNPHPDNGIKLFGVDGFKLPDSREEELERRIASGSRLEITASETPQPDPDLGATYLEHLHRAAGGEGTLQGLRIALDCANGAASPYAVPLFEGLGARVVSVADNPNGANINLECGSTHPEGLAEQVVAEECDLGIAFDGDADRAILIDERGQVRDGDAMLYLWARDLAASGELPGRRIVATTMSNLGLETALGDEDIAIVRCGVGDRKVVATMQREGIVLGGEQSGHLVHLGVTTTGDGLFTALHLAELIHRSGLSLSEMLAGFRRFPQVLLNVRVRRKPDLDSLPSVRAKSREIESKLGGSGRLVLRYSGTEPLARVMIEGPRLDEIEDLAGELITTIRAEIGLMDQGETR